MGSSSFIQPLLHFPSSSSSFYSQSSLLLCTNNARTKRRNRLSAMASMRPGDPKDNIFIRRKTILLVGISVLPLLNLRARALDGLAPSECSVSFGFSRYIYIFLVFAIMLEHRILWNEFVQCFHENAYVWGSRLLLGCQFGILFIAACICLQVLFFGVFIIKQMDWTKISFGLGLLCLVHEFCC